MNMDFDFTLPLDAREQHVRALLESADRATAARILGQSAGLQREKIELAERIVESDLASPDLLPLVRHLPPVRLSELAARCVDSPPCTELLLEIARHSPAAVRPLASRIEDARIAAAIRAEAPDEWVVRLHEAYEREHATSHVRAIGQVRTDRARSCLIDVGKRAPAEHREAFALALENCGVFPNSRFPSIYFDAFRGYVVSRDESPHHVGPPAQFAVPLCPFCQTPAERLLSLNADALGEDYELAFNPSFFWYRCACDNGSYILVRHTDSGMEGVMTAMTDGPVDSPLPPASLLLEPFPRTSIVGGPARPGAGEHQVGGYPVWIEERFFPRVPGTDRGMMFLASVDLAATPLGQATGQSGIVYCFLDDESRISVSLRQTA
jgi:hypothetical protein